MDQGKSTIRPIGDARVARCLGRRFRRIVVVVIVVVLVPPVALLGGWLPLKFIRECSAGPRTAEKEHDRDTESQRHYD